MALHLSGDPEADALITSDALALLVGMVLDQQIGHVRNEFGRSVTGWIPSVAFGWG
ncbi:hypothetical protein ThrDRAFT_04638 [Frankia casuarinae]|jgi:hypothetical protein|nr:hypothetical protein CcI6DRAFT_03732 [Frankia sp. CcI6]EYT89747.1 hypothetical protein ThrDRAFT_04638 [Frankia casuarinae]KDA40481.1 hypothetical protein BMG523Draft_04710 [Frankia sp. BMG5.23]KEZ34294.1 hypothetical protein CEDDRAFT_04360 [Frankia sp. CeD]KFB02503.1 hypothetical protein ALLO2DRAFT_04755 [Frankia sp. Allo2]